mgnify:CR=1 FL=1
MHTEDEARRNWCPMVRALAHEGHASVAVNRAHPDGVLDITQARCIASDCMWWRWVEGGGPGPQHPDEPERDMRGFCGFAGKDGA